MIVFSFIYAAYADLLIGAYVNTENADLLDVPSNWGPSGNLNYSDQLTVILGYVFYFVLAVYPFFVLLLVKRHRTESLKSSIHHTRFEKAWGMLISSERTDNAWYLHYCAVYILRRTIFVMIGFFLYEQRFLLL